MNKFIYHDYPARQSSRAGGIAAPLALKLMATVATMLAIAAVLLVLAAVTHAQMAPGPTLQITPGVLPDAVMNTAYSQTLTASTISSGQFSWNISSGSLPPGLTFSANSTGNTATITGTPNTTGAFTFTVVATDHVVATAQTYVMNVVANSTSAATTTQAPSATTTPSSTAATTTPTSTVTVLAIPPVTSPATSTPTSTGSGVSTSPETSLRLQSELNNLMLQLIKLQNAVKGTGGTVLGTSTGSSAINCGAKTFCRDLTIGSRGTDVRSLQAFLNARGAVVAPSGPGSSGNETEYFGALTQSALAGWQAAHGVSPARGYFGPSTRALVLSMMMNTSTSTATSTTSSSASTSGPTY